MCEKRRSELWLFSDNDIDCLCHALEGKYCPFLLLLGVTVKGDCKNFVNKPELTKGICKGMPIMFNLYKKSLIKKKIISFN